MSRRNEVVATGHNSTITATIVCEVSLEQAHSQKDLTIKVVFLISIQFSLEHQELRESEEEQLIQILKVINVAICGFGYEASVDTSKLIGDDGAYRVIILKFSLL